MRATGWSATCVVLGGCICSVDTGGVAGDAGPLGGDAGEPADSSLANDSSRGCGAADPDCPLEVELEAGATGTEHRARVVAARRSGRPQYLVVWCDPGPGGWILRAMTTDARGSGHSAEVLAGIDPDGCSVAATSPSSDYVVAWIHEDGTVRATRVDGELRVLDEPGTALGRLDGTPWIVQPALVAALSGETTLIAWHGAVQRPPECRQGSSNPCEYEAFAARIDAAGTLLDPEPISIPSVRLAADGASFLIAAGNELFRLDDGAIVRTSSLGVNPTAMVEADGGHVLVWVDDDGLRAARLATDGSLGPQSRLSRHFGQVALARDCTGVIAAWIVPGQIDPPGKVMAARWLDDRFGTPFEVARYPAVGLSLVASGDAPAVAVYGRGDLATSRDFARAVPGTWTCEGPEHGPDEVGACARPCAVVQDCCEGSCGDDGNYALGGYECVGGFCVPCSAGDRCTDRVGPGTECFAVRGFADCAYACERDADCPGLDMVCTGREDFGDRRFCEMFYDWGVGDCGGTCEPGHCQCCSDEDCGWGADAACVDGMCRCTGAIPCGFGNYECRFAE